MSNDILTSVRTRNIVTPQTERALPTQVKNDAGGFVFSVTDEERLRRFLILGTSGGSYYQGERELTKDNADILLNWARTRTVELVDILVEISEAGRAPKQNPTIFALAAAAGLGDDNGRAYALANLPRIARTGTHLFLFSKYVEQFRGWGRGLRNAVGSWYETRTADSAAYQVIKYRQREGWSHRDLLRKTHPNGASAQHAALYDWVTKGNVGEEAPALVHGFLAAQSATTVKEWTGLIDQYGLAWEMLPDAALNEAAVWNALLDKGIPMGALIRQLPRLTRLDVLKGDRLKAVVTQLNNQDALRKARIHPVNMLVAQTTYASGHGKSAQWKPNVKIVDAMNDAFYLCFGNVEIADKRTMDCLDVSGSMTWQTVGGTNLTDRDVAAAMSLVTAATEPEVITAAFSAGTMSGRGYYGGVARNGEGIEILPISARQRLDDVVKVIDSQYAGGTDCALPMQYAMKHDLEIDTFVVWTDSETWAGRTIQPYQALEQYRKASGIPAKLVVAATSSNGFSIANPDDAGMLDVVGFDSAVPQLIADFSAGRV